MGISEINYLAVIVAAIVGFSIGSLWYGPLFGKTWNREVGFREEKHPASTLLFTFVFV